MWALFEPASLTATLVTVGFCSVLQIRPAEIAASYERLSKLSGTEFDREYAKMTAKHQEKDVAEFQRDSQDGKDESIKHFAVQTLPTLQEHLQLASRWKRAR